MENNIKEQIREKKIKRRKSNGIGAIGLALIYSYFCTLHNPASFEERLGGLLVPLFFLLLGIYFLFTKPNK